MISTDRLKVRHMTEQDYEAMCQLDGNPDVRKFTGAPLNFSKDAFRRTISPRPQAYMAVCTKHDGRCIGRCGFREKDGRVELEIFLSPDCQKLGFGSELFRAMVEYCAANFPDAVPAASVSPQHEGALRLLKDCGFTCTGEAVEMQSGIPHVLYVKGTKA
jgi:RimJ/RimL family protein N-acetyltransferase